MAIIKLGPVVSDARGSVGGTVFSRNAAGAYMKQRTTPTWPGKPKQINITTLLSTVIDDWKTALSTPERDAWNSLAAVTSLPNKLGEQFSPSGWNLFMKANMMLDLTGQDHITAAPVAAIAPAPQLTIVHSPGTGLRVVAIGNWDTSPSGKILYHDHLNGPLSVNYYKGPYTYTISVEFSAFDTLPLALRSSSPLIGTSRAHMRLRAVHADGMASHPAYYSVDVGPVP
ncbi:hypothetical protein ES708_22264 [subsurface metagenome]